MCDYSLRLLASRPAKSGDRLIVTRFFGTTARGFASVAEPHVAICLQPGTQLAFDARVSYERRIPLFRTGRSRATVASFIRATGGSAWMNRDALEFPNGKTISVAQLREGQIVTVLQLPASSTTRVAQGERVANAAPSATREPAAQSKG